MARWFIDLLFPEETFAARSCTVPALGTETQVRRCQDLLWLALLAGCGRMNPLNPDYNWEDTGWIGGDADTAEADTDTDTDTDADTDTDTDADTDSDSDADTDADSDADADTDAPAPPVLSNVSYVDVGDGTVDFSFTATDVNNDFDRLAMTVSSVTTDYAIPSQIDTWVAGGTSHKIVPLSGCGGPYSVQMRVYDDLGLGSNTESLSVNTTCDSWTEDFELGNADFSFSGTGSWYRTTPGHAGSYSLRSAANSHSTTSSANLSVTVGSGATVSFWHMESTESCCDDLRFYVDGTLQAEWSGSTSWAQATYVLSAGSHTLRWDYYKDSSVSTGSDAVWIDDIVITAGGPS